MNKQDNGDPGLQSQCHVKYGEMLFTCIKMLHGSPKMCTMAVNHLKGISTANLPAFLCVFF